MLRGVFLIIFLFCWSYLSPAAPLMMTQKPSLKLLGERLKNTSEITSLFKDTGVLNKTTAAQYKKMEQLWKLNSSVMQEWLGYNQNSTAFSRGEIDEESVLNNLLVAVQLSLLQVRTDAEARNWSKVKADVAPWFSFASDMTYEEASLVSLRLANVIRSLLMDDIESIESQQGSQFSAAELEAWMSWLGSVRVSWPIDRVLLTEAKKILSDKPMFTAQQMAIALQKNAYQTAAQALKAAQGPKTPELKLLEKMWREEDIQSMRTEVHRVTALKIRLAKDLYKQKFAKDPSQIQELVDQHLLKEVPIDYASGKAFTLETALH